MYLSKKKTLKFLAYCATSAIFFSGSMNIAGAENIDDENSSSNNTVEVTNSNYSGGWINGGEADSGEASNNTLKVSDVDVNKNYINGGLITGSTGNADGNTVTVRNVRNIDFFHGGYAKATTGSASYNIVNIYNSHIYHIHGGHSGSGVANYNTVNFFSGEVDTFTGAGFASSGESSYNMLNIFDGTLKGTTQGGYISDSGTANENDVNIKGGDISGKIYGGYVGGSGTVSGNKVNIYGGKISGDVYGGSVGSGTLTNNEIHILPADGETTADLDLTGANLYAGSLGRNIDLAGNDYNNSLNIHRKGVVAQKIGGFDTLNFELPSGIANGETMLTLTDDATDLTKTKLYLNANGGANLNTGDTITLLENQNGIKISGVDNDEKIAQGISLDYGVTLGLNDAETAYTATIGEVSALKRQTDLLGSAIIDSAGLLDSGTDRLAEWLPPEGLGESIPTTQFNPFAGIGGSVFKIKTSDGQKLKSKNAGIDVGMARFVHNRYGVLVFGPITDYGRDSYESHLTHPRSEGSSEMYTTDGHGSSQYFAAGIIARQMSYGGMYYEGSLRAGRVHTDFSSDNFLVHNKPTHADYSASTPCFAGHIRVGWSGSLGGTSRLDAYGIYSLNRVNGFTTKLSTGEDYRFSAVNSGRIRIGTRLTREIGGVHTFYSGLAYVQEFTGETQGVYLGRSTNKAGLKGTSGLIELGYRFKQNNASNTMLDASMIGWVGHQKGVTFSAKFKKDF